MSGTCTLVRRELLAALAAPVTWLAAVLVVLGLHTVFFFLGYPIGDARLPGLWEGGVAALDALFAWVPLVLCLLAPALTMGAWAEERKAGTDELLLTLPFPQGALVLGKFLAAWILLGGLLSAALLSAGGLVAWLGPLDTGTLAGGLVGAWLLAAPCAAIGCLASAVTSDQLAAFLLGALALFALWSVALFARWLPPGWVEAAWSASPALHFLEGGARGWIDARDVLYQVLVTAAALLLNRVVLEGWRWR